MAGRPARRIATVAMLALAVACTSNPPPVASPTSGASTPASSGVPSRAAGPSGAPGPPAEHRIGVRVVDGAGELFDRLTGKRFVARGVNLVRLHFGSHSTLDVGRYDPERVDEALRAMADRGYNVVRVFLNALPGGLPGDEHGLSAEYLDNVADFLGRARTHGMYVLLTQDWLPESPAWPVNGAPGIENVNAMYLAPDGVAQNERFFRTFASGLVARGAALDALLAYELRNELYLTDAFPPFSLAEGEVATANGEIYDLADRGARRRLLEENLVAWIDRMRSAILAVDPTALVTVGFFQPHGPNRSRVGDDRLIETRAAILRSTADLIDLHGYPGGELDLRQIVENFGLPRVTAKPILLGEFGAERASHATIDDAVRSLVEWQVESCAYGFDGWLHWTWDTHEQPEFWNALDGDGALADALSPRRRADPCSTAGVALQVDLAEDATVTASRPGVDGPPTNVTDGNLDSAWIAGDGPPQWIELDLGGGRRIETIRLLVTQHPAGRTTHVVTWLGPGRTVVGRRTFRGRTEDGDWLTVALDPAAARVRYVRIETTASPSWVAWREIDVIGRRSR
jgi:hypothetical protein